jgi:hypothetical protein
MIARAGRAFFGFSKGYARSCFNFSLQLGHNYEGNAFIFGVNKTPTAQGPTNKCLV